MILSEACATTVSGLEPSSFVLAFNDTTKEKYLEIIMETSKKILSCAAKPLNLMHLSMASPTPPPPGLDGEIVGIWQSTMSRTALLGRYQMSIHLSTAKNG